MRQQMDASSGDFLDAVFTPAEIARGIDRRHPARHFAASFAAKEAVIKAMSGAGASGSYWLDIEVDDRAGDRPDVRLRGRALELADGMGVRRVHLTLAHTQELATAGVVLEG